MFSKNLYVLLNSSSVSPGNPTIMSVVRFTFEYATLNLSTISVNCSIVYLLFILFNVSSHPLCNDKWKCSHIFSSFVSLCTNSSVISNGSIEPNLILSIPSITFIFSSKYIMSISSLCISPLTILN